jgi:hypothetical protein
MRKMPHFISNDFPSELLGSYEVILTNPCLPFLTSMISDKVGMDVFSS